MSGAVGAQDLSCAARGVEAAPTSTTVIRSARIMASMVRTSRAERKRMLESAEMRVWRVFATYVAAVAGIFSTSGVAILALKAMFPDVADQTLLESLPGLIA